MKDRRSKRMRHGLLIGLLVMIMIHQGTAYAADKGSVELAKQSIYCVQTCLVDEANEEHYEELDYPVQKQGSCFVVGNINRGQEQYLITAKSNLNVDESRIKAFRKQHKLKKEDTVNTRYRVLISQDVIRTATVYDKAGDSDYAILKLGDELPECPGLVIGNSEEEGEGAPLFLLSYNTDTYSVDMQSTSVQKMDENTFSYEAESAQSDGAALVDEEGRLIGMHIPVADDSSGAEQALSVGVLQKTFDMLGIAYDSYDSKQTTLGKQIEETRQLLQDGTHTKKTVATVENVLAQAQDVYEDDRASNDDYEEQLASIEEAVAALRPMHDIYMLIVYILSGVIALLLLILSIRMVANRKKEKQIRYLESGQEHGTKRRERTEDTAAGIDDDRTIALDRSMPTVFLLHKATGKKMLITKAIYSIGSKEELVDYCIKGNAAISRRHAAILNENGVVFIQDLNSMNHVYVNNVQVEPGGRQVLRNGDSIRLANEEFLFELK